MPMALKWYRQVIILVVFIGTIWLGLDAAADIYAKYESVCGGRFNCPTISDELILLRFMTAGLAICLPIVLIVWWRFNDPNKR
jgi:hypothetical protein